MRHLHVTTTPPSAASVREMGLSSLTRSGLVDDCGSVARNNRHARLTEHVACHRSVGASDRRSPCATSAVDPDSVSRPSWTRHRPLGVSDTCCKAGMCDGSAEAGGRPARRRGQKRASTLCTGAVARVVTTGDEPRIDTSKCSPWPPGALLVGGAVRDLLLGLQPADLDWQVPDPAAAAQRQAATVGGSVFALDEERDHWRVVGPQLVNTTVRATHDFVKAPSDLSDLCAAT